MSSLGPNRVGGRSFKNAVPVAPGSSPAPSSTYNRRGASGRFIYHSRESSDVSADMSSIDGGNYTVHIPATPDHQPMYDDPDQGGGGGGSHPQQQQYVSNTMFTGGFNSLTRGHVLDKMTEAEGGGGHHQSTCHMQGCDTPSLRNDRGEDIFPCECNFKICRDCYVEALKGDGRCPGCKEIYKAVDSDDPLGDDDDNGNGTIPLHALPAPPESKMVRRLSLVKSSKHHNMRNQNTSDFDHDSWLHETKGTYGYGNAVWPKDQGSYGTEGDGSIPIPDFKERARRPLTRKVRIPSGILSPYRLLVVVRFVALAFYLRWRIINPNPDAIWLWGMSVVCELWFAFSWILDQMPKLNPINRTTDLACLKEKFETRSPENPSGRSDLPGVDFFVSSADPEKEPPLVTSNTILSILACEYPVEKLACYLSDDGGALLSFEALAEAASFAKYWVPFCRKHSIEPRNPDSYFSMKKDPTKNKIRPDFIKDRRRVKREYDEYKVRINGLSDAIRRRSDAYNAHEEIKAKRAQVESGMDLIEPLNIAKATWMSDRTHWPGTWIIPSKDHSKGDHAGIIQVMLPLASSDPILGSGDDENTLDFSEVDIRLPLLVYMSREKRSGYDHNKKAGAMNALVRSSAIISNGPFILNLDCDHYINNSTALREGICFMLDRGGENVCYVQFPQRFEGIDTHDRYANHNTVFFDGNMRALDGLQGPMYVGTGCLFRRVALYGFDPPRIKDRGRCCGCCVGKRKKKVHAKPKSESDTTPINSGGGYSDEEDNSMGSLIVPKRFGSSNILLESIPVAEFQGRPLADHPGVKHGRPPGALINPHEPIGPSTVAEALSVISCWFEGRTEWGRTVGWIYGSVTEDVVTGYCMHKKGWRSIYCVTKRDAFRGTAPINLTDRLHQVLRWATGSVEIFFSRNNGILAGPRMKLLQGIAYLNVGIYPFTSIFLVVYCFLPALSLFTGQFIVRTLSVPFLIYLLLITITLCLLAVLEVKWSGITLEEWWRNEQFWLIGGTSAHLAAVMQGLLKVMAGVDISFTLTSKSTGDEEEEEFADLYVVRWTSLMIPPLTIMLVNMIAIAVGIARTIYSTTPEWSKLLGGTFFSLWVLVHLYPFAKGLMGRRGRTPTILWVWAGLLSITISLLWVAISNPNTEAGLSSALQIP